MKKFDELKALAEKQAGRFDLFIGGSPENLLALLADREQLREALRYVQQNPVITPLPQNPQAKQWHFYSCVNEALKKSDEVENG